MSIQVIIECDVLGCGRQQMPGGGDPTAITGVSDDTTDFVIDQHFYLPDGWTRSDDVDICDPGLYFCPEHTSADAGIDAAIRRVREGLI